MNFRSCFLLIRVAETHLSQHTLLPFPGCHLSGVGETLLEYCSETFSYLCAKLTACATSSRIFGPQILNSVGASDHYARSFYHRSALSRLGGGADLKRGLFLVANANARDLV